jgi:hypothetical protein
MGQTGLYSLPSQRENIVRMYYGVAGRESVIRMESLRGEYILESFYYPIHRRWHSAYKGIFLDSGAFTAWKEGKTIDLFEYAEYGLQGNYEEVAGDLRIGDADPEVTLKDTEYLRGLGLNAIPCFHQGEKWEYLEFMIRKYPHISLGCTEKVSTTPSVGRWLRECFERICDEDGFSRIKVHGFRFTSWMSLFPFYSVDSTSWCQSSGPYSFATLSQTFPFLQPVEVGELVKKYYDRRPKASRLIDPIDSLQGELPLFNGVLEAMV